MFCEVYQLSDKFFRSGSERQFNATLRAEKISDDGKATSLHSREKQCGSAALDHAAMNLGNFEIWIDFSFDGNEIVFATQEVEEGAKV